MKVGQKISHQQAWHIAIEQAKQGLGQVSPNPPVGAVFVDQYGCYLSSGYHKKYGDDHAEIVAWKNIKNKEDIKGGSLYVTLEPCSYRNHTPSCAKYLASLPLARVYIGLKDPNPRVNGRGLEILNQSGIEVQMYEGELKEQLHELIEMFSYHIQYKKPFVGVKIASSLDGSLSLTNQRWLTNQVSRNHVALLRGYYDAVCIGVNTLLTDDPRLNSRHPDFLHSTNQVVILDPEARSLSFLENSKLLTVRDAHKVWIVTGSKNATHSAVRIIYQEANHQGLFDIQKVLIQLFQYGIYSVLVEGGGVTFSHFLPVSQRIYLFLAPLIAQSSDHANQWHQNVLSQIDIKHLQYKQFESDLLVTGRVLAKST